MRSPLNAWPCSEELSWKNQVALGPIGTGCSGSLQTVASEHAPLGRNFLEVRCDSLLPQEGNPFVTKNMSPLRLILLALLCTSSTLFAQFTFTGDGEPGVTPKQWENAGNWKTPAADPAPNFPDNGDNVEIPRASINVTTDIEVGTLKMDTEVSAEGTLLNLGANTFTINGASTLTGKASFLNGTLEAQGAVDLQGGLFLDGTDMSFSTMNVGSGGGTGNISLSNGAMATNTGTLSFPKDTQVTGSTNNPGTLVNEGTWSKTGSTGQTAVSSLVSLSDGSILQVDAGSMLFSKGASIGNATINTQLTSGQVGFTGPVAITDQLNAVTGTNARIVIDGLNGTLLDMSSGGKIASSGSSEVIIGGGVVVKGGEFLGSGMSPVVLSGTAVLGQESPSTNSGRFIWDTGTINNLTNTATGADSFTIENANLPGNALLLIADGTLQNEGRIEHSLSTVRLDQNGILNNALGGVYDFEESGSVLLQSGSNGQFLNSGILTKSGTGLSFINANLNSSNRIEASNGQLRIANATISNVVRSDRGANAGTTVELGTSGSSNSYGDINFELDNAGVVEFISGNHLLGGTFTSSGNGTAESPSSFAVFQVPMNGSAAFNFISNAPFIAGTTNTDPQFILNGSLSNSGTMQCFGMRLSGSGTFKNTGDFTINSLGVLEVSEIGGASSGAFQNNGIVRITGSNSGVRVQENGLFLNNEAGGPDANPTGGTLVFDSVNSSFSTSDTSTATHLRNLALIRNADGGNIIGVNFDQPSTLAEVRVETDSLTLSKMTNISGGRLASHYLDFGTNPTPSRLNITGPSITGGVTMDLMNGGQIRYSGFNVDHQLTGALFGQGSGECQLLGGLMRPMAGSVNGGFNFTQNTLFRLNGGTIGSLDGALGNVGNFVVQSGLIQGSFNNGGSGIVTQTGGTVQGIYTNNGTYNWQGATIGGQFSNGTAVTMGGILNLQGGAAKALAAGATIDTWNEVNHLDSGSLQMQNNSKITVRKGSYIFHSTGSISSSFATGTVIRIDPEGTLRKAGEGFGPNLSPDTFSSDGTLQVDGGTFGISSDPIIVNGGTAQIDAGTFTLARLPEGTQFDSVIANGSFRVNSSGGGGRADYPQTVGQTMSGSGTVRMNLQQGGTVRPGSSPGTLTVDGDLVQSATAITEIEIAGTGAGQFDVVNVLDEATVAGTFAVSFTNGFVPQLGDQFAVITSANGVTLGSLAIQVTNAPFVGEGFTASVVGNDLVLTWNKTGTDFQEWKEANFTPSELADPLISGPTADPDSDGIANFFEFIFGFDPKSGNGGHPIEFRLVDGETPGQQVPRFEVAVAANASGYSLKVELVDLTASPPSATPLTTTSDPSAPSGMIALEGAAPVAIREFYQVLAFGRGVPQT